MKCFSSTQIKILNALADGTCLSGNAIAKQVGISRTAIWKQIKSLTDLGVPIKTLPQHGYQLSRPFKLLDEELIRKALPTNSAKPFNFHLFTVIDSTNQYLKGLPISSAIDICCAEKQTQGRGRFGRHWHSPFGENIYCSSRWQFQCDPSELSGLSLVISLAVLNALSPLGLNEDICIKWPNDVYWKKKKLCGTLIEFQAESHGVTTLIIGVGINVNSDFHHTPEESWGSLYEILGRVIDRNALIAALITNIEEYLERFTAEGFKSFQQEWSEVDYLHNKLVVVSQPSGSLTGIVEGVNQAGQLVVREKSGTIHTLSSGEASLKTSS